MRWRKREAFEEFKYRYLERIGLLVGDGVPNQDDKIMTLVEVRRELKRVLKNEE